MGRYLVFGLLLLVAIGVAYVFLLAKPAVNPRFEPLEADRSIPVISARSVLSEMSSGQSLPELEISGSVPSYGEQAPCPATVVIIVHGFNNSAEKAMNRFGVARQALRANGYEDPVVGFSWFADTQHDPYSATGYHAGRDHARRTAPYLAQVIDRMKQACPSLRVAVIGYSMGARLALETLLHIRTKVDTVHLVGAAVDNEEVEVGEEYGKAIEERTGTCFNYFSPEDSKLGLFFWVKEGDRALGKADIEHGKRRPRNFVSRNSASELPEVDEQTGLLILNGSKGKNHSGYLGTRDNKGSLTDDGVMDLVAHDIAQFK